jgi:glycosyltransferase involved in cell wall biosynthesis
MRNMKIWITQDGEPLPSIDPGARYWRCALIAEELIKKGHQVIWWASTFDHAKKKYWFNEACTIEPMHGLKIRLLHGPGYSNNKSFRRFSHQRSIARAFEREIEREGKPELIFSSLPTLELAEKAVTYGIKTKVPVVVDIRDLWPDHYLTLVPKMIQGFFRILLLTEFKKVNFILKSAFGISAISKTFLKWGLNYAERLESSRDAVFEMGYPREGFSGLYSESEKKRISAYFGIEADLMNITFIGSVNSIFDFDTVLKAAKHIQHTNKSTRFIIVGDGTNFSKVRTAAKSLSNVIVTGRLDKASVAGVLSMSAIGLTPHKEGQTINGALPNKSFEYMAAGLPHLSSLRGELEDLISKKRIGIQYQSGSVESLIKQIRWLSEHPLERKNMGQRSLDLFNKKFCAEVIYPRLVNHLEIIALGN